MHCNEPHQIGSARRIACALAGVFLAGCAGIHVQQLSPDGMSASGQPGLRYYMPSPYLLVTRVPAPPASPKDAAEPKGMDDVNLPNEAGAAQVATAAKPAQGTKGTKSARNAAANAGGLVGAAALSKAAAPAKDKTAADVKADPTDGAAATASAAAGGGSDASYQHMLGEYQVKLIYLPDKSRPMAITMTAGIGMASMQPTLIDGWMLTSLQGTADSKVAEVLSSVASLITANKGPASKSAGLVGGAPGDDGILAPGLYKIRYTTAGVLDGVCAVTLFGDAALAARAAQQLGKCTE